MAFTSELTDTGNHSRDILFDLNEQQEKKKNHQHEVEEITKRLLQDDSSLDLFTNTLSGILKKYDIRQKPD